MECILVVTERPSMNSNHVSIDLGATIEGFDALRTLVLQFSLVTIHMQLESSGTLLGVLKRFIASVASQCVPVKE